MLRAHNPKRRLIAGVSEAFDDIEGGTEELIRQVQAGHWFSAVDSLPAHAAQDDRHREGFWGHK